MSNAFSGRLIPVQIEGTAEVNDEASACPLGQQPNVPLRIVITRGNEAAPWREPAAQGKRHLALARQTPLLLTLCLPKVMW